ncbi:MAG: cytochrome c peroxidase [Bacteroidota bacterium]
MRIKVIVSIFFIVAILMAFIPYQIKSLIPSNWPKPVYDFTKNEPSIAKINLGRVLFYDPILSQNNTISCASCHLQYTAFTHIDHALSHGINDKIGTRNSPTLINLAWNKSFMWDGAVNHLDMQALAPIAHPAEMGSSIDAVVTTIQQDIYYKALCFNAYQDSILTGERILKALSSFELTFISADAKYDSVMRNQAVFTAQEANGYLLFKQYCASCHTEPLFTNGLFENNGLREDSLLTDKGRMRITNDSTDLHKFKVPTLRNIEYSYPYMHDGRFKKLGEVLTHYTSGIDYYPNLSAPLNKPIILNSNEKVDMIAFLLTLSDRHFLFNKNYGYIRKDNSSMLQSKD